MLFATSSPLGGKGSNVRMYLLVLLPLVLFFADAWAQGGAWTQKAGVQMQGGSACVVNGKIFVLGGCGNGPGYNDLVTNEAYDPATNTWKAKTPMPTARGFLSTAVVKDTIYAIGGGYPTSKSTVEAFNPATNTWTTRANMLSPRLGAQAAVVDGKIYNIGGNYSERNCEAYDPATNTWTAKAPIPGSGGVVSLAAYNGLIYAFGGGYYTSFSATYAYDPLTDTWTKKRDMPTPRFAFRTYVAGGKIYALGGSQGPPGTLSTVEVYDPIRDTWEAKPNMPDNLAWFAGAVIDDKIYVISGTSNWMTAKMDVWEFDPAFHTDIAAGSVSGTWTSANSPYYINGEVSVPDGQTLTIQPGVEVVFTGHHKLNVQGRLLAVGTENNIIRFTAANTDTGWHGIRFINTPGTNDTSRLVYCSFKHGKANTGAFNSLDRCGGAVMINSFDRVLVSDCLFEGNLTAGDIETTGGPGICIVYGSPTVTRCTFRNNVGTSAGAIKVDFTSRAVISHNIISQNVGYCGAILCAYGSDNRPTVSCNVISDNASSGAAGGIFVYSQSSAHIENNVIVHNTAPMGGGISCYVGASPVLVNNTIAYNTASTDGGGIHCESNSDPILVNNIVYGNSAPAGKQVFLADANSDPNVEYSNIEGGKNGFGGIGAGANYTAWYENNIDSSPSFVDTARDDYHLSSTSPCNGTGIDSVEISGVWYHAPPFDVEDRDRPRPVGSRPDIGAYESPQGRPSGVSQGTTSPKDYVLYQNYPNPFNPKTVISAQWSVTSAISLIVYDVLGRIVAILADGRYPAGRYSFSFDGTGLASGLYFYRMRAGTYAETKIMSLIR